MCGKIISVLYSYQEDRWIKYIWRGTKCVHQNVRKNVHQKENILCIQLFLSCQVMSNCLQPHGLQHARLPYPSPIPGACSTSCPLSRWCHPTILSSVAPSTPVLNISQSQDFCKWVNSSHQVAKSIGSSAIASVFPIYIQDWFHLGLTGLISLLSKELSQIFPNSKTSILGCSTLFMVQLSHPYMTTEKNHNFD